MYFDTSKKKSKTQIDQKWDMVKIGSNYLGKILLFGVIPY